RATRWARVGGPACLVAGLLATLLALSCGPKTSRKAAAPPAPPPAAESAAAVPEAAVQRSTVWMPRLGPPRAREGRVVWAATPDSVPYDPVELVRRAFAAGHGGGADSVGAWRLAARPPPLRAAALRRLAPLLLDRGDTAGADSCWRLLARERSPWTWEAARNRSVLAAASRGALAGDSILAGFERQAWPDSERAAWLVRRAGLRAAGGDTSMALDFSRQAMRRFPSATATAGALTILAALLGTHGATLWARADRAAAGVAFARGDRAAAAGRLERAYRLWVEDGRWRVALRRAEVLHAAREFPAARTAAAAALHRAPSAPDSARCLLERARREPDSGAPPQARPSSTH